MRFGILGALQVTDDVGRPLALAAPKQRAVLTILLLHANEFVSSDRLAEDLWAGMAPASAAKSLQVHVSRLRRALSHAPDSPEERLVTVAGGYLMRVLPGELDAELFERVTAEASALIDVGDRESALAKLRLALDLWRGRPLSD
ncbi:MAG: winged helix-turn-helix domain-containing protein, partial [Acetobacteraceae bacterium]|nr:winged helix-turn-helix domain-containing protein [Acetobacteraceae bacterium]